MAAHYCALFGENIEKSYSPYFHQQFAKQYDINLVYEKIAANIQTFHFQWLKFVNNGGFAANVTMPCKRLAYSLCTRNSKAARAAASVNTISIRSETEWLGDNTDGVGFIRDLVDYYKHALRGRRILLLGAGGAAAGLLPAILDQQPAHVRIANRTLSHAQTLAAHHEMVKACDLTHLSTEEWDFIINTAAELPLKEMHIPCSENTVVYDIRYTTAADVFLQWVKRKGAGFTYNGYGMLLEQAAASFNIWFGVQPITAMLRQKVLIAK